MFEGDPFSPLAMSNELSTPDMSLMTPDGNRVIISVPDGVESPEEAATRLYCRNPDLLHEYRSADGQVLFAVARWNKKDGSKDIRPLSWVRQRGGSEGWAFAHYPAPRPLYNLDFLAAAPDVAVVVTEGEKVADAAARIFPDYVATTSPAGAYAASKADWSPLRGRRVLIVPDANDPPDKAGKRPCDVFAEEVAAQAFRHAAAEVIRLDTVTLSRITPDGSVREGPGGWDLADALDEGWSPEDLRQVIEGGRDLRIKLVPPPTPEVSCFVSYDTFTMDPVEGLFVEIQGRTGSQKHFVAAPFEILGRVRTTDGFNWARLLRWQDADGRVHTHAIEDAELHGDIRALAATLASKGLKIATGKSRSHLATYLNGANCNRRVTKVERTGWHEFGGRTVFVLPDRSAGAADGETVILSNQSSSPYEAQGSLSDWQDSVGRLSVGQTRLVFAISAGFAGMLLHPAKLDGGGINFYGASSTGKSTTVEAAASVHGRGASPGFVRSWRATANALEAAAALHTDTLLVLDELGVVEARDAAAAAYQLAAGTGKGRSARDGSLRSPLTWRTIVLSTGEIRLADKLRESNQRAMAGQAVRLLDIPADAGKGFGVFDHPGETGRAKELADQIKLAARTNYGTAGPAFVERLVERGLEDLDSRIISAIAEFRAEFVPPGSDGQVQRAADRFGLIAATGELATELGVVPWSRGDSRRAAAACFQSWLDARGGTEPAEVAEAIGQVRRFIEAHGQSRFEQLVDSPYSQQSQRAIVNRVGYRQGSGEHEEWWVLTESWKSDVCAGLDPKQTARFLAERGMLTRAPDGFQCVKKIAGRSTRVYVLNASILRGAP